MQRLHQHNAGHMFQQFNWIQTSFQGNTHSDWATLHQALHYFPFHLWSHPHLGM